MERIVNYFMGSRSIREFSNILLQNNYNKKFDYWLKWNTALGILLFIIVYTIIFLFSISNLYITIFAFFLPFFPLAASYFFHLYKFETRKRSMEKLVPDVLLQASIFPKGTPTTRIIKYLSKANYAALSEEFAKAVLEIEKGASVVEALGNIKKRSNSRIIDRAINLLIQGYNSGCDMGKTFKEAANDLLETNSILRERGASMIIEKYTLLFAGGFIVPLVLGLIVGLVAGLNFGSLQELEIGMDTLRRESILSAALLANQIYIAEYAILASLFIANQENNLKKGVIYTAILLPLSLIVYNLAQAL